LEELTPDELTQALENILKFHFHEFWLEEVEYVECDLIEALVLSSYIYCINTLP
jgi:hypothetical protein